MTDGCTDGVVTSLSALRDAILSRRDVLVRDLTSNGISGPIHHAAEVAGRLHEVLHVYLCLVGDTLRVVPRAMRIDAAHLPTGSWTRLGHDHVACSLIPVYDPRAPRPGGRIVILYGRDMPSNTRVLEDLAVIACDVSSRDGRQPPLLASFKSDRLPDEEVWTPLPPDLENPCLRAFRPRSASILAVDPSHWYELSARRQAGIFPVHAEGLCYLRDEHRLVVAHGLKGSDSTMLVEFGTDGWASGSHFGRLPDKPATLEALVRSAWDAGPICSTAVGIVVDGELRTGSAYGRVLCLVVNRGEAEVLRLAASHADMRSAMAVRLLEGAQLVLRRAQGHPRRHDFIRTWGALAEAVLDPDIVGAVDNGLPTLPLMAARLGVSEAVAERLAGRVRMPFMELMPGSPYGSPYQQLDYGLPDIRSNGWPGGRRPLRPGAVEGFLTAIGLDNLPLKGDDEEWGAFCECSDHVEGLIPHLAENRHALPSEILLRTRAHSWMERLELIRAGNRRAVEDVPDFLMAVRKWLTVLFGTKDLGKDPIGPMIGERSLPQLGDVARAWRFDLTLFGPGMAGVHSWPVPFAKVDLGEGWEAVCLASHAELLAEGGQSEEQDGMAGLERRVDGYHRPCSTGDSLIVSLRNLREGAFRRVSTLELKRRPEGDWAFLGHEARYVLSQHRGHAVEEPSTEAVQKAFRLRTMMKSGSIEADPTALILRQANTAGPRIAEADWAEAVLPVYQQLFPRPWRGLDPEIFRSRLAEAIGGPTVTSVLARTELTRGQVFDFEDCNASSDITSGPSCC